MFKIIDNFNGNPIISDGIDKFVINENDFNGEIYRAWKYGEELGYDPNDNYAYSFKPIYQGIGEPDEDGDYISYDIIGYDYCY
jgi:hypothetical protein